MNEHMAVLKIHEDVWGCLDLMMVFVFS